MNEKVRELINEVKHEVNTQGTGKCRDWCLRCRFNAALAVQESEVVAEIARYMIESQYHLTGQEIQDRFGRKP